ACSSRRIERERSTRETPGPAWRLIYFSFVLFAPARDHAAGKITSSGTSTQGEEVMLHRLCAVPALVLIFVAQAPAAETDLTDSLTKGTVELKSAGPLAFGPQGILFVGDPVGAVIYAIDTGDRTPSDSKGRPKVEGIDGKIASLLGTEA